MVLTFDLAQLFFNFTIDFSQKPLVRLCLMTKNGSMKTSIHHRFTGSFIKRISVLAFTILICFSSFSAIKTAVASGNFTNSAVWAPSGKPVCGDQIIIPPTFTISLSVNEDYYSSGCLSVMQFTVLGTLYFPQTRRLYLPCNSEVSVFTGGLLDAEGSNNSQRIFICSIEVWNGLAPGAGPLYLTLNPLPIELTNFMVKPIDGENIISWATLSEINNDHFELERSDDGLNFSSISKINSKAPNGNSNSFIYYETCDYEPLNGINYYRIKQTDLSKRVSYSNIFSLVNPDENIVLFTISPNPNSGRFFIDVKGIENNKPVEVKFYDKTGKIVHDYFTDISSIQGKQFNMNLNKQYEPGVYVVVFNIEGFNYYSKLVLE